MPLMEEPQFTASPKVLSAATSLQSSRIASKYESSSAQKNEPNILGVTFPLCHNNGKAR